MRTLFSCLLCICLATPGYPLFSGGDGSAGNPYKVSTPDDLALLATNKGATLHFEQTNDIDLAGYLDTCKATGERGWQPIGKNGYPFQGNYDGAGFRISGLWISRPDTEFVGFFGFISGDTVKNLTIETLEGKGVVGGTCVGALCGNTDGVIKNCTAAGTITGREQVGALAGANWGIIDHSAAKATVTATVKSGGGLCGTLVLSGSVLFSHAYCTVIGGQFAGGLVGSALGGISGMVMNSFAEGTVTGTGFAGGIIGASSMKVYNSYSLAAVAGDAPCGGIAGSNGGTINGCYFVKEAGINEQLSGIGSDSCAQASQAHAVPKADITQRDLFASWDFDYVWSIDPAKNNGNPYPSLKPITDVYRGAGTRAEPFIIESPQQLQALTWFGADSSLSFTLNSDIDLSPYLAPSGAGYNNGLGWLPINDFSGKLDGAGHAIRGLWLDRPYEVYAGLILFCRGMLANLRVEVMAGKCVTGLNEVGILCSEALTRSAITNCSTGGCVKATDRIAGDNAINKRAGGLVGDLTGGTLDNCHSSADCFFEQKDSVIDDRDGAGGLVGYNDQGTIVNCYATGKVTCQSTSAGGLIGQNYGTITNSFASGEVSVAGRGIDVGGFAGTHGKSVYNKTRTGTISRCFSTGTVTATGTYASVGGFVGTVASYGDSALIRDAYATGGVTAEGTGVQAGGFMGVNGGKIENCYFSGVFRSPATVYETGDFAGVNLKKKTFRSCRYLKSGIATSTGKIIGREYDTINPQSVNITGCADGELKMRSTFTGWNFDTIWAIEENVSYPVLHNQPVMPVIHTRTPAGRAVCRISTSGRTTIVYHSAGETKNLRLCLYNSNGRRLVNQELSGRDGSITVKRLAPGLYVAAIVNRAKKTIGTWKILIR